MNQITRKTICTKCKKQTRKETLNTLSIRLQPKSESVKNELAYLRQPGEITDEKIICEHCKQYTSRRVNITSLKTKKFLTLVIDKPFLNKLNGRSKIQAKWELKDFDKLLEQRSDDTRGSLVLKATIHHHGQDHRSGHYTISFYNLEENKILKIDDSIITELDLSIEDGQILTEDTYIILYEIVPDHEVSPSEQKEEKKITHLNPKIPQKRGRKPKVLPKDEKQKSITHFFQLNNPPKEKMNHVTCEAKHISERSILYANIRSLNANKIALDVYVERYNPQIIALVETWMKPEDYPISLNHDYYEVFEKRRISQGGGGGLAILVDKHMKAYNYTYKDSDYLICLKILSSEGIRGGCLFLIVFYAPPKLKKNALEDLKDSVEYLKKRYNDPPILIVGDFNLEEKGNEISNLKYDLGLSGLLDESHSEGPWIESAQSCYTCNKRRIDFPLYINVDLEEVVILPVIGTSDHKSLLLRPKMNFQLSTKYICRMSKKFLTNKLLTVDLEELSGIEDYILLSKWLKSVNIPLKITKRNFFTTSQRFLTSILKGKEHEETLTKAISQLSKIKFRQTLESILALSLENKPREMHNILQTVMRIKSKPPIIEGISNPEGKVIENSNKVLSILTDFFKDKYDDHGTKIKFPGINPPQIKLTISEFDIIAKKINTNKGNGYDYIPLSILNMPQGKKFILSVVNEVFQQKHPDPTVFSTRLMLLSKTGSKFPKVTEIRPIAITTLPQKVIEHVLLGRLELEFGDKISNAQFGFRPRMETLMHILRLIDKLQSIRDSKPKRFKHCLVFIDFSTAFDSIDHHMLLTKMESKSEFSQETLNLLKWYLSSIHLRLEENMIHQNRGSPQGGVASPFLWLIYINDLLVELEELVVSIAPLPLRMISFYVVALQ